MAFGYVQGGVGGGGELCVVEFTTCCEIASLNTFITDTMHCDPPPASNPPQPALATAQLLICPLPTAPL